MSPNPTALIAEDEPLLAENLRQELRLAWPELQIVAIAGNGQAAVEQALALRPTLCFLDIRMPGLTGLEAASALAEDWPGDAPFPLLVFVTAYEQYALQAFEYAAADYVLKPVQPERLAQTCKRLQGLLAQRGTDTASVDAAVAQLRQLLENSLRTSPAQSHGSPATAQPPLRLLQVGVSNSILMVPVDEVIYFEAADKYVRVLTREHEHLLRISLKDLLPQIDTQRFWQVHRSLIVRADAIDRAVRDTSGKLTLHLRGRPERLVVSRMYAHLFKSL